MKALNKKIIFIFISILFVFSGILVLTLPKSFNAYAEEIQVADKTDVLIPKSFSECFDFTLSNPKGAIYYNDGAILIRDDNTLWVFNGTEYVQYDKLQRNNPTQIHLYNQNYLLINDDAMLYVIDLTDLTALPIELKYNDNVITCDYFYLYQKKLLTKFGTAIKLFTLDGLTVTNSQDLSKDFEDIKPKNQTPIAINAQDEIFFISSESSSLYKQKVGEKQAKWFDAKDGITEIVTTENCIYFIKDAGIYKIENGTEEVITLTATPEDDFELGNVVTPLYLSVKEDKLLIADSGVGAISEFKVTEQNSLEFTGYAIAKNKTAYNRLPATPSDIDLNKNSLKIYGDAKVLEVKVCENFDSYDKLNFSHTELLEAPEKTTVIDVYNNVYSIKGDGTGVNKLYKNDIEITTDIDGVTKLETDLFGNLYSIKANQFRYLKTSGESPAWVTILSTDSNIISFTMDIEKQTAYYLLENSEFIYKTKLLNNACISALKIQGEYVDKYPTVTQQLKAYQINPDTAYSIYSVNYDKTKGEFVDLSEGALSNEYAYLATASFTGVNGEKQFIFLADTLQTVVVNKEFLTEKTIEYTVAPDKAFITMPVNGYFLPLITNTPKDQIPPYALGLNGVIRLQKEQVIHPVNKFTFLNQEYYLASFTDNNQTVTGYVPVSFTVPVLAQDKAWETYRLERVEKTYLYSDNELKNKLIELADNSAVKIITSEKGVLQVIYQTPEGAISGYISASKIIDTESSTVTTVLIVLAACASVCGTLTFFLLRKKKQ